MEVTNAEWIVGRHGRPLMTVRDQQGLSRFSEEPHLLRESLMTQTKRQSKLRLFALALLAALAMSAGLVRGPTDEEVLAQAVRDVAFGDRTVLHPAAVAMVHADERPQVTNVIESKFQHSTPNHAEKKGQPITLSLTSTDRPHRFLLEALKIDRDIPPRNNNGE
jgi:hypothetical protein